MKISLFFPLLTGLLLFACTAQRQSVASPAPLAGIREDSLFLFDTARNRSIPIAIYEPSPSKGHLPVVLFSHGYGENHPHSNAAYTYLTRHLAAMGFYVASIQHELPSDPLMPTSGVPQVVRRPNWERGAANIQFVYHALKRQEPRLDFKRVIVIGHSNGGDMSALFTQQHPELVAKFISLDNRRMALPRTAKPQIYSLRAVDTPADEGVLPTVEEQHKYNIKIVNLESVRHADMSDGGTAEQHRLILQYIEQFVRFKP